MRELTDEEQRLLAERRERLEAILAERMPVLTDFFQRLGHPDGAMVLVEAERFVADLDAFLGPQEVGEDDRAWLLARVAYFLGELLVQRHGGRWLVDDAPGSRHFLRVVVGDFTDGTDPRARLDPFAVAAGLVDQPPPRSLAAAVEELERELAEA